MSAIDKRAQALWHRRKAVLLDKGLGGVEAWWLLELLAVRDAECGWDRPRVCHECRHMGSWRGGWWCSARKMFGSDTTASGQDFPMTLKHCPAFVPELGDDATPPMQQGELPFE